MRQWRQWFAWLAVLPSLLARAERVNHPLEAFTLLAEMTSERHVSEQPVNESAPRPPIGFSSSIEILYHDSPAGSGMWYYDENAQAMRVDAFARYGNPSCCFYCLPSVNVASPSGRPV